MSNKMSPLDRKLYLTRNHMLNLLFKYVNRKLKWSWAVLAERAGLGVQTVYKLGHFETMYPRDSTVQKLVQAVGWTREVQMNEDLAEQEPDTIPIRRKRA
jgi:hypothetical protein